MMIIKGAEIDHSTLQRWVKRFVCLIVRQRKKPNELASQIDANEGEYELYQYRDREKREIDFLIEREDQAILGIEVKSRSSVHKKDFKHLQWFQENLAKEKAFVGIVLYSGNLSLSFGQNLLAIPISMLWPSYSVTS